MHQVQLKNSHLIVSKLIYGTGSLMRIPIKSQRLKILELACSLGFTHFDTAPLYGHGNCENELGEILKLDSNLSVTTKIGLKPTSSNDISPRKFIFEKAVNRITQNTKPPIRDFSIEWADSSLKNSLKRLRRERIDLLLLHEAELSDINNNDLMSWLEKRKDSGDIIEFGFSGSRARMDGLHEIGSKSNIVRQESADIFASKNIEIARSAQIRFGYIRQIIKDKKEYDAIEVFRQLIKENREDAVIISATKKSNLLSIGNLEEIK